MVREILMVCQCSYTTVHATVTCKIGHINLKTWINLYYLNIFFLFVLNFIKLIINLETWTALMLERNSQYFPSGDHFVNSHNLFSCLCVEIAWRKLTLVTLGLRMVVCVAGVERDIGVGREGKGPYSL